MSEEKERGSERPSNLNIASYGTMGRLLEAGLGGYPMNVARMKLNAAPDLPARTVLAQAYKETGAKGFYSNFRWSIPPSSLGSGVRWVVTNTSDSITSLVIPSEFKNIRAASIGALSPAISVALLSPFSRMQVLGVTSTPGQRVTLPNHIANNGFFDLWKGARVSYIRGTTVSLTFNLMYVNTRDAFLGAVSFFSQQSEASKMLCVTGAAAVASVPHALLTTPIDMIKDQMQKDEGLKEHRVWRATKTVYSEFGLWGMTRTAPLRVARSSWYFAFTTAFMYQMGVLPSYMMPAKQEEPSPLSENKVSMK